MKKKLIIPLVFCWMCFSANAQITVTMNNYTSSSISQKVDTMPVPGINPGNAGANQTYNFAALNSHLTSGSSLIMPSLGVLGAKFPMTNVCMIQDTMYFYFDSSSSKLSFWGVAGDLLKNSVNNAQVYSNPQTIITFPSTYNTAFSDTALYDAKLPYNAYYQGYWVDSVREKERIITVSNMDGWGTVSTPLTSGFPCLRQNIMKYSVDSSWAKVVVGNFHYWLLIEGVASSTQSYSYVSKFNGPIVDIEYYADSNAISEVRWNTILFTSSAQFEAGNDIRVFPNPTADYLTITNSSNENLNLKVFDLTGRVVLNTLMAEPNKIISVADLENGTYLVELFNKEGLVKSDKIVIIH